MHIDKYNWSTFYFKAFIPASFVENSSKEDFFDMIENITDIDDIIDMHETMKEEDFLKHERN